MEQFDGATAFGTPPTAPAVGTAGFFTVGNPVQGIPATIPGEFWFHSIETEIINVITGFGLTPSRNSLTQLFDAINLGAGAVGNNPTPVTLTDVINGLNIGSATPGSNAHVALSLNQVQAKLNTTLTATLNIQDLGGIVNLGAQSGTGHVVGFINGAQVVRTGPATKEISVSGPLGNDPNAAGEQQAVLTFRNSAGQALGFCGFNGAGSLAFAGNNELQLVTQVFGGAVTIVGNNSGGTAATMLVLQTSVDSGVRMFSQDVETARNTTEANGSFRILRGGIFETILSIDSTGGTQQIVPRFAQFVDDQLEASTMSIDNFGKIRIRDVEPGTFFENTQAPVDAKIWEMVVESSGSLIASLLDDEVIPGQVNWLEIPRTLNVPDSINFLNAPAFAQNRFSLANDRILTANDEPTLRGTSIGLINANRDIQNLEDYSQIYRGITTAQNLLTLTVFDNADASLVGKSFMVINPNSSETFTVLSDSGSGMFFEESLSSLVNSVVIQARSRVLFTKYQTDLFNITRLQDGIFTKILRPAGSQNNATNVLAAINGLSLQIPTQQSGAKYLVELSLSFTQNVPAAQGLQVRLTYSTHTLNVTTENTFGMWQADGYDASSKIVTANASIFKDVTGFFNTTASFDMDTGTTEMNVTFYGTFDVLSNQTTNVIGVEFAPSVDVGGSSIDVNNFGYLRVTQII